MNSDEPSWAGPAQAEPAKKKNPLLGCLQGLTLVMLIFALAAATTYYVARYGVQRMSDSFLSENIEESFKAETERIASTNGNVLEVATHESMESYERETVVTSFNQRVPGTGSKVLFRVPATFRFHVKLDGKWDLWTDGPTVIVRSPALEPTLPVAFDTTRMDVKAQGGIFSHFRNQENMEVLHANLTPKLEKRAQSQEMKNSVRDACRQSVAMFVKNWLLSEDHWGEGAFTEIKVLFPDEMNLDPATMPATVSLEPESAPVNAVPKG